MKNIAPLISGKVFRFEWQDPMHLTRVQIKLPDLDGCEYSSWADWGPMFEFKLKTEEPITIWYNHNSFKSSQQSLCVESPILAQIREQLPYYIAVEDKFRDLLFHLFVDKEFELKSVDVYRLKDRVKLYHTPEIQSRRKRTTRNANIRHGTKVSGSNRPELRLIHPHKGTTLNQPDAALSQVKSQQGL